MVMEPSPLLVTLLVNATLSPSSSRPDGGYPLVRRWHHPEEKVNDVSDVEGDRVQRSRGECCHLLPWRSWHQWCWPKEKAWEWVVVLLNLIWLSGRNRCQRFDQPEWEPTERTAVSVLSMSGHRWLEQKQWRIERQWWWWSRRHCWWHRWWVRCFLHWGSRLAEKDHCQHSSADLRRHCRLNVQELGWIAYHCFRQVQGLFGCDRGSTNGVTRYSERHGYVRRSCDQVWWCR